MKKNLKIFLEDIKDHKLYVKLDNDIYKHLVFKRESSQTYRFDLMLFPNHLVITGDMGSNTFTRTYDMFEFFRDTEKKLRVNPSYWAEKIIAEEPSHDLYRGEQWDIKVFYRDVLEHISNQFPEKSKRGINKIYNKAIKFFQENDVDAHNYRHLLCRFDIEKEIEGLEFGYFEYYSTEFNYHYLWRCYAIVWGIQQYDEMIASPTPQEVRNE